MVFWIGAAVLAAGTTGFVVTPLRHNAPRLAFGLTILVPLLALAVYFLIGNPQLGE